MDSDGVLTKLAGKQGYYDAHAVLHIDEASSFQITVKYAGDAGRPSLAVGLTLPMLTKAAAEAPSFSQISRELPGNCTVQIGSGGNIYPNCNDLSTKLGVMQSSLSMQYMDGTVAFTFDSPLSHSVTVPAGDYRPFVFLGSGVGGSVHVSISRKRRPPARDLNARIWRERKFTDAEVVCRGRRMPVHRAVLSAASPVFERMWEGSMREANEATLEMDDAAPETVEAMLQYVYTGGLPSSLEKPAPLFQIAKKYGLDDLAEEMGALMLEGLDSENVEERVRAIRLHAGAGDTAAHKLWGKLFAELHSNQPLLRALLEQLTQ